jgi:ATP-dependent Clp protease ATP-binding subunit ClpA
MFESFDEQARRALFFARASLDETGGDAIVEQHLLLGVVREAPEAVTRFTDPAGWESVRLRDEVMRLAGPGWTVERMLDRLHDRSRTSVEVPFSDTSMALIKSAAELGRATSPPRVRPEHFVLAMLLVPNAVGPLLAEAGVTADAIRAFLSQSPQS